MAVNRADIVDGNFRRIVENTQQRDRPLRNRALPIHQTTALTGEIALQLFESQILSRHLDFESRRLKAKGTGFYTIGSAGHEGNVVLGRLLRPTDPTLLHYRSGALMLERMRHDGERDAVLDILLSYCAAADDPVAGGRHKIWGSRKLWVPPQTSTIASHLPKAVGMAMGMDRARKLKMEFPLPSDSIVCCTFGDASANHSTALGAFNAAQWAAYQRVPVPILFVCEDNGIGISVRTPENWIHANFSARPGLKYFRANGLDLAQSYDVAREAIDDCRSRRSPVFLHLDVVRLLGHAGSDVETEYLSEEEIEIFEGKDPLPALARWFIESDIFRSEELLQLYELARKRVAKTAVEAEKRPRLRSAEEVMKPLAPYHPDAVWKEAIRQDYTKRRDHRPETETKPRHLAMLLNWGLGDLLVKYPEMAIFGEDVAKKGGVYHVTTGLSEKFGVGRVFNTLLDEQTILGLAIGMGHLGFLPFPEIQYLAYYHNAEDQIRGEAASLQFFSNGQFRNPMVIRIASFAYQKGFGGHFHNDNSIAALRDVPGAVIAVPTRGDDAVEMLRTVAALAKVDGRVVFFLEPIALYMTKDLYAPGDGAWQFHFPQLGSAVRLGSARLYNEGEKDATIITYGNGLLMSLRAAKVLKEKHHIGVNVLDLRWLAPLPEDDIRAASRRSGRVLVVDECRKSGGVSEAIMTLLAGENGIKIRRICAEDTYVPLGPAADTILPSESQIVEGMKSLVSDPKRP